MTNLEQTINKVYGISDLAEQILKSVETYGISRDSVSVRDLSSMDELHSMGREATVILGEMAGLTKETKVLDIGSGVGGAARTLADEFGCRVTGIDLTEDFCRAANELSLVTGLEKKVSFMHGNALSMPFEDESYDVAIMFHVNMNISDKESLFKEVRRVLKPSGKLSMWEIARGDSSDTLKYPVPWADDASASYLIPHQEMNDLLNRTGFSVTHTEDATAEVGKWAVKKAEERKKKKSKTPGINVVIKNFRKKQANIIDNMMNDKIRIVRIIAVKK